MNSKPVTRTLLHSRQISCQGYQRDDGLWDIEAQMVDTKTYDLVHADGSCNLKAGDPLHQMRLCVTVDAALTIVDARAHTVHGPHRECPQINDAYAALKGLTIGSGFIAAVKLRFKGAAGCTHLTELMGTVATVAYQTLWPLLAQRYAADDQAGGDPARKPAPTVGTCFALRAEGEVVRIRWPRYYQSLLQTPPEQ